MTRTACLPLRVHNHTVYCLRGTTAPWTLRTIITVYRLLPHTAVVTFLRSFRFVAYHHRVLHRFLLRGLLPGFSP